ncbi:haloacid dehydrogenase [Aeromonas phage AerS_266]|nr:haloacid dehydrogenase [Aeromonas phage AerS_266]
MHHDMILAFDMDDTLCNTHNEVYKRTLHYCLNNFLLEESVWLTENPFVHFSDYTGDLKQIVLKEVIEKREYMNEAQPSELLRNLVGVLDGARVHFGNSIKIVICTHRGDNIEAWMSTYNYLKKHGLENKFDMIHSIDHEINKDKLGYLEKMYPSSRILLIDDNPFGSKNEVRGFDSRVLMYNEVTSYKCHMNQAAYLNHIDLLSRICSYN